MREEQKKNPEKQSTVFVYYYTFVVVFWNFRHRLNHCPDESSPRLNPAHFFPGLRKKREKFLREREISQVKKRKEREKKVFSSLPFLGIVVIRPRADVKRLMLSTSHFYPGQVILNPPHVTKKKTSSLNRLRWMCVRITTATAGNNPSVGRPNEHGGMSIVI